MTTALAQFGDDDDDLTAEQLRELENRERLIARRTRVMFLRNAGGTIAQIANELGISISTVRKDLTIVRRDINNEQPTDVVARHRAVIFDIQRANYSRMMAGDKDAAATILKALHREAQLLGLDAPTRILAGVSDVEFANEAARLIERITQLDQDALKELHRGKAHPVIDGTVESVSDDRADVRDARGAAQPGQLTGGDTGSSDSDRDNDRNNPDDGLDDDLDGWSNIS